MNYVNVCARERGIAVAEQKESESADFNELVTVSIAADGGRVEVAGTGFGPRSVPHLVSVYGQENNIDGQHLAVFATATSRA